MNITSKDKLSNNKEYVECIVGNIMDQHIWGEDKLIKRGTKHFRPGAKVYCIFMYGGMGHERVRVLGQPRKTGRMIDIVIRTNYIKNFRLKKVYNSKVIAFVNKYPFGQSLKIESFLNQLNKSHIEINYLGGEST